MLLLKWREPLECFCLCFMPSETFQRADTGQPPQLFTVWNEVGKSGPVAITTLNCCEKLKALFYRLFTTLSTAENYPFSLQMKQRKMGIPISGVISRRVMETTWQCNSVRDCLSTASVTSSDHSDIILFLHGVILHLSCFSNQAQPYKMHFRKTEKSKEE